MIFFETTALVNSVTSLFLAYIIITRNRNRVSVNFSIFLLSISAWSASYFIWQISPRYDQALFWAKLLTLFSAFIPLTFLRFVIIFLKIYRFYRYKIIAGITYLICIFFVLISFSNLLVADVHNKLIFKFWPDAGPLYWLFIFYFAVITVISIYLLFLNYSKVDVERQTQIKYLLWGVGSGFWGGSTNFFLWYDVPIYPFGNILVSLYMFIIFAKYIQAAFSSAKIDEYIDDYSDCPDLDCSD